MKDPFTVLGVSSNASAEEVKKAYISRVRVLHPDRFDQQTQKDEWEQANEMLRELNEAYSLIKNGNESEYTNNQNSNNNEDHYEDIQDDFTEQNALHDILSSITHGKTHFEDLTNRVKRILIDAQNNQFPSIKGILISHLIYAVVFLLSGIWWNIYIYNDNSSKWDTTSSIFYFSMSILSVSSIYLSIKYIELTRTSALKSGFFISNIYIYRCNFGNITFYPIWTLENIHVTENHTNGVYTGTTISLEFTERTEEINIKSRSESKSFTDFISSKRTLLNRAIENSDIEYVKSNNFFSSTNLNQNKSINKKFKIILLTIFLFCAINISISFVRNMNQENRQWINHQTDKDKNTSVPSPTVQVTPEVLSTPLPEATLPPNGETEIYTDNKLVAPLKINTSDSHAVVKVIDKLSNSLIMKFFVQRNSSFELKVPLGTYKLKYASGERWYGYHYLFGPDTAYTKTNEDFEFKIDDNKVSGYTVTLYKVQNGNLQTEPIRPEDF